MSDRMWLCRYGSGARSGTMKWLKRQRQSLKRIWNDLVADFLNLDFVRALDNKWNPFDSVDELELVLKLTRWTSIENFNRVILLVKKKLYDNDTSLIKHALKEPAFTSRQADFIIYGHTHHAEIIALDAYHQNEKDSLPIPGQYRHLAVILRPDALPS